MNILVGFEESQAVANEFRKLGHEAFSNDIQSCSGGHPEYHLQMNFFEALTLKKWDIIITFQPCTDIAVSGASSFQSKRLNGRQEKSIRLFFEVWKVSNCSENPIGILNGGKYIKQWFPKLYEEMLSFDFPFKPTQIIQPYFFGDPYKKSTCLWLKRLPKLVKTNEVEPVFIEYKSKKSKSGFSKYSKFGKLGKGKGKERSKTPIGLAKAMAEQWSKII